MENGEAKFTALGFVVAVKPPAGVASREIVVESAFRSSELSDAVSSLSNRAVRKRVMDFAIQRSRQFTWRCH